MMTMAMTIYALLRWIFIVSLHHCTWLYAFETDYHTLHGIKLHMLCKTYTICDNQTLTHDTLSGIMIHGAWTLAYNIWHMTYNLITCRSAISYDIHHVTWYTFFTYVYDLQHVMYGSWCAMFGPWYTMQQAPCKHIDELQPRAQQTIHNK